MKDNAYQEYNELLCNIENNNSEEVLKKLEIIQKKYPNSTKIDVLYSKYMAKNGNKKEARKRLLKTLELLKLNSIKENANKNRTLYSKGLIYFELGTIERKSYNFSKAQYYFEKVITTNCKEKISYAMLELGKLKLIQEEYEEARYYINSSINNDEKFKKHFALEALAELNTKELNYEEAIKNYKEAITYDGRNKYNLMCKLIYLYIHLKRYEEAYKILPELKQLGKQNNFNELTVYKIESYLNKVLHKKQTENVLLNSNKYLISQTLNYNEDNAIRKITNHQNADINNENNSIFYKHINIIDIYNTVKKELYNIKPSDFTLYDHYIFTFDINLGEYNNISTKSLKVITLPHTKNILTMYPEIYIGKNDKKIEVNIISKKLTKKSQIDKFNLKYGLK